MPDLKRFELLAASCLAEKKHAVAAAFERRFGQSPTWMAAAPGRINVIGEHVDYCEGLVLPMAIDRHVLMAACPSPEYSLRVASSLTREEAFIALDRPLQPGHPSWANYVRGVVQGFVGRGLSPIGLNVWVDSDLPMGGGLSSSAALEVATATLLEDVTGRRLSLANKARLCQQAEHMFAGVPCGIMDQFASVYGQEGHLLLIDCRSEKVKPVPLSDPFVTLLVINTNVRHELGASEYPVRRAQCEEAARRLGLRSLRDATLTQMQITSAAWPAAVRSCARHVITEIARVLDASEALGQGDWSRAGRLMYASHASLRDDFKVSCAELDLVVSLAGEMGEKNGIYGCRMTGGGFGGSCVALIQTERAADIARTLGRRYAERTGLNPAMFVSRPAQGAHSLENFQTDSSGYSI